MLDGTELRYGTTVLSASNFARSTSQIAQCILHIARREGRKTKEFDMGTWSIWHWLVVLVRLISRLMPLCYKFQTQAMYSQRALGVLQSQTSAAHLTAQPVILE